MRKKKVRRYIDGGKVSGPGTKTSDSILARLSNGEYVLPAESVEQVGLPKLEAIRRQGLATRALRAGAAGLPRYKEGGRVGKAEWNRLPRFANGSDPLDFVSDVSAKGGRVWTPSELGKIYGNEVPPTQANPAHAEALKRAADLRASDWERLQNTGSPKASAQARYAPINTPTPAVDRMSAASIAGRTLPLAGENIAPALGMVGNIANNVFSGIGLPDAIKLGYDQARFDEMTSEGRRQYFNDVRPIAPNQKAPVAPTAASVPATPGNEWGSLQDKWGIERPRPGTLPEMPGTLANRPPAPSPAIPTGSSYQDPRDYSAQNPDASGGAMRASGTTQLPGTDIYRRATAEPGFGPENPNRIPGPGQIAGTTTYTPLGVSAIGGGPGTATFQGLPKAGGTLSVIDQGNGGTVAGNVAAINRQIEAQQSLREAQNPGITTGQAGRAFGDLVSIGTPGGNFGDEAMRQQKILGLLSDAGRKGIGATRRKAILESAQQMAALPQPPGVTRLPAEQGQPGIDPYKLAQLNMDQQKFGLDQRRFAQEQNNASYDQALKDQQLKLHAFLQAPEALQKERMDQIQAAYYQVAQAKGPDSPEAKKLAAIMQTIHGAKPQLDLTALMQQQKP